MKKVACVVCQGLSGTLITCRRRFKKPSQRNNPETLDGGILFLRTFHKFILHSPGPAEFCDVLPVFVIWFEMETFHEVSYLNTDLQQKTATIYIYYLRHQCKHMAFTMSATAKVNFYVIHSWSSY